MKRRASSITLLFVLVMILSNKAVMGFQDYQRPKEPEIRTRPSIGPLDRPVINEFRAVQRCEKVFISYQVSNTSSSNVRRVRINALGAADELRTIYETPATSSSGVRLSADRIVDSAPDVSTQAYVLAVWDTQGASVSRRINFRYAPVVEPSVDNHGAIRKQAQYQFVEGFIGYGRSLVGYKYGLEATLQGISSAEVQVRLYSTLAEPLRPQHSLVLPVSILLPSTDRRTIRVWNPASVHSSPERVTLSFQMKHNLDSFAGYEFEYHFRPDPPRCSTTAREITKRVAEFRGRGTGGSPPPDDRSTGSLPDLVPVIVSADGARLQFRIENRGSAPVTRTFSVQVTGFPGDLNKVIEVRERIDPGRSWISEVISTGKSGGAGGKYIRADTVTVTVDLGNAVAESNEANNGAQWERMH